MEEKDLFIARDGHDYLRDLTITWKCGLCGDSFGWARKMHGGCFFPSDVIVDHAPYVVTLADGKPHSVCSQECARSLGVLVGIDVIVSRLGKAGT